jgi:uncharacterized protein YkwD
MVLRYCAVVVAAAILATAVALSISVVQPENAQAATATVRTCNGRPFTLKLREKRIFLLHNHVRKKHGLKPLCVNTHLTRSARFHSREMINKDYFSHRSYNGEGVGARLRRFGYDWSVYGENIAGGYGPPSAPGPIFKRWMNSAQHRANILNRRFRQIGVGTATGNYKGHTGYTMYTVDFGRPG